MKPGELDRFRKAVRKVREGDELLADTLYPQPRVPRWVAAIRREAAAAWLLQYLRDGAWYDTQQVREQAELAGHIWIDVCVTKDRLPVKYNHEQQRWTWRLGLGTAERFRDSNSEADLFQLVERPTARQWILDTLDLSGTRVDLSLLKRLAKRRRIDWEDVRKAAVRVGVREHWRLVQGKRVPESWSLPPAP